MLVAFSGALGACSFLDSTDGLSEPSSARSAEGGAEEAGSASLDATIPPAAVADGSTAPLADSEAAADAFVSRDVADAGRDAAPTTPTAIYPNLVAPLGIAVRAGTLCWVAGDTLRGIFCAPAEGGSAADIETVASQAEDTHVAGAFDVALDGVNVYWSNGPTVVQKPVSGGASTAYFNGPKLAYLATQDGPADGGTQIWASDYSLPDAGSPGADILVGPIGSSTSEYLYEGEPNAAGVAVYGGLVYWGRATSPGYIAFGPSVGKTTSTAIAVGGPVTGVAADDAGTVYFIGSDRYVYRLALGGTTPVLVYDAGEPIGGGDVAVDESAVYLSERALGRIMRLPK